MTDKDLLLHATRFEWTCPHYNREMTLERRIYDGASIWFLSAGEDIVLAPGAFPAEPARWMEEKHLATLSEYPHNAGFPMRSRALQAYRLNRASNRPLLHVVRPGQPELEDDEEE